MDQARKYLDRDGCPTTLAALCRDDPGWAVSRIAAMERCGTCGGDPQDGTRESEVTNLRMELYRVERGAYRLYYEAEMLKLLLRKVAKAVHEGRYGEVLDHMAGVVGHDYESFEDFNDDAT